MKISVLPTVPLNHSFLYESEIDIPSGTVVKVPFGSRLIEGVVVRDKSATDKELKHIEKIYPYNIGAIYISFLNWVSAYTLIPRGMVLKMILAEKTLFNLKKKQILSESEHILDYKPIELNNDQLKALESINNNGNKPFLLEGVTGSGKTEVYLKKAKELFDKGKQILILFPEIALSKQMVQRIAKYFGIIPIVWNSSITSKNRRMAWLKANSGEKCVIIGARSAIFIPFKNLGLIVVDEEHDSSYKQEEGGFYNARDMAVVLAHLTNIPIILSSATPSIESYVNAKEGKYSYFNIKKRYGNSLLPNIKLIDMKQNKFDGFISIPLFYALKLRLEKKEQSLIYLNRRGYAPITLCKNCGEKISCPNCSTWLVYHKKNDKLICHYCGHLESIPQKCKNCSAENSYIPFGPGVERVYDELCKKFPEANIEIASSDTFSSEKEASQIIENIQSGTINIVIGTQILAKGHHFPNITLVGVIDGDLGLNGADLRSAEKTYQMINQVAGRAGRGNKPGEILIQTFNISHPLFETLKQEEKSNFMELEVHNRKKYCLPPFSKFASLIISGNNREITEKAARLLKNTCPKNIKIFGPAPAPMFLLRGRFRWRILLKSLRKNSLNIEISKWIESLNIPKNVRIQIDIDPITFL